LVYSDGLININAIFAVFGFHVKKLQITCMVIRTAVRPSYLKIIPPIQNSMVVKTDRTLCSPWHFHPEIELLYCMKGKGTNFIGNSITSIEEGELFLFGKNLPHTRIGDDSYYQSNGNDEPEAIVIQFREDFLGDKFFDVSEFAHLKDLLERANRGIRFSGKTRELVAAKLSKIRDMEGLSSILELLHILDELARSDEYIFLNAIDYVSQTHEQSSIKINKVYQYTISHFREDISLDDVASLTNHSIAAFCRYFKAHTRKTYFQYLTEVRIAYACKLLGEGNLDINEICLDCGFNNLSHFHKQFKKIAKFTPSEYQKRSKSKVTLH
jgi:AraC-like DNA-binding protein